MLTDRGTEYCGRAESHDYQLYLAITTSSTLRPRRSTRRPMGSASASTRRCSRSSTRWPSAGRSTVHWRSCSSIWTPGSSTTTARAPIKARCVAGAVPPEQPSSAEYRGVGPAGMVPVIGLHESAVQVEAISSTGRDQGEESDEVAHLFAGRALDWHRQAGVWLQQSALPGAGEERQSCVRHRSACEHFFRSILRLWSSVPAVGRRGRIESISQSNRPESRSDRDERTSSTICQPKIAGLCGRSLIRD